MLYGTAFIISSAMLAVSVALSFNSSALSAWFVLSKAVFMSIEAMMIPTSLHWEALLSIVRRNEVNPSVECPFLNTKVRA